MSNVIMEMDGEGGGEEVTFEIADDTQFIYVNVIPVDQANNMSFQIDQGESETIFLDESTTYDPNFSNSTSYFLTEASSSSSTTRAKTKKKPNNKTLQVVVGPDGNPVKRKGQTELKCMEKGCFMTSYNVAELRKHLNLSHGFTFDEEVVQFNSDADFKTWRETYERERMVSFIYRGGTKKVARDQAVTYLICHRSGHYKPTMNNETLRKRKLKPQGSCKMGGYCTAGIKLMKNVDTGIVKMEICHTHYGHPLDSHAIPHLRLTPALRKVILTQFKAGLSFTEVLAYIHHNPDRLEGLRLIDRRAVRNIYDTWKHPTRRSKQAQKDIDELGEISIQPALNFTEPQDQDGTEQESNQYSSDVEAEVCPDQDGEVQLLPKQMKQRSPIKAKKSLPRHDTFFAEDDESSSGPPTLIPVVVNPQADTIVKEMPTTRSSRSKNVKIKQELPRLQIMPATTDHNTTTTSKSSYGLRPKKTLEVHNTSAKTNKRKIHASSEEELDEEDYLDYQPKTKQPKKTNIKQRKSAMKPNLKRKVKIEIVSDFSDEDDDPPVPPPMIISELLEQAIDKLLDHGDSGPTVLLYKPLGSSVKYGVVDSKRELRLEDFCVVLQTPVQRQLLQMFPNIIGFDYIEATKASQLNHLKLAFLMVLDEFREPIPIAWLLTNSVDSRILSSFFKSLKRQCGDLKDVKYIMAPRCSDAYKTWCTVFTSTTTEKQSVPCSILNDTEVRRDLKSLVWSEFSTDKGRREVFEVVESLIIERQVDQLSLEKLEEKFEPLLDKLPHSGEFMEKLDKEWLSRTEEWNLHYRIGASVNIMGASNAFTRLKKFIHFKGTKNLDENFEQILKIGYDKCFLRSKRMFKGDQKFSRFLDKIADYHMKSRQLKEVIISNPPDPTVIPDLWIVSVNEATENCETNVNSYNVSLVNCQCDCKLICRHCKVCQHLYTCSCAEHILSNIMCEHIHLVHCHRNDIVDEPELITGDLYPNNTEDNSAFGRIETCGTEENPGSTSINVEAVLKAAGLFHRSDGLQPDQIVSITDADTQAVIYEITPTSSGDDTIQVEIHGEEDEAQLSELQQDVVTSAEQKLTRQRKATLQKPNILNNSGFRRIENSGAVQNPGGSNSINIEAVLKAAGLFHGSDTLHQDQIVSLSEAETQATIIYEINPESTGDDTTIQLEIHDDSDAQLSGLQQEVVTSPEQKLRRRRKATLQKPNILKNI